MIKVHVTVRRAMTVLSLDCHCGSIEEEKKACLTNTNPDTLQAKSGTERGRERARLKA